MTRYAPLWEQAGSYAAGVDRRLLSALWPAAVVSGMQVTATSGMVLAVAPGSAAVPTVNNTGSVLCVSDAIENVTLTAAPAAGNSRIDVVYVQPRGGDLDGGVNNDFVFAAAAGTPAPSAPAVPAIPSGALALANVAVGGGVSGIVAGNITDQRTGGLPIARAWNTAWGNEGRYAAVDNATTAKQCGNTTVDLVSITWAATLNRRYIATYSAFCFINAGTALVYYVTDGSNVENNHASVTGNNQLPVIVRSTVLTATPAGGVTKIRGTGTGTDCRAYGAHILTIDDIGPVPGTTAPAN